MFSKAETPPFAIDDDVDTNEDAAPQVPLPRSAAPELQKNLIMRSQLSDDRRAITSTRNGFLEIETPFMVKYTPGGARNYLVPSRVNPAASTRSPQSPQIFKQLLMVAGLRALLPDRALLPRRGPARRPPAGVHADRHRDVVRRRRRTSSTIDGGPDRRAVAEVLGIELTADPAPDDVRRGDGQVRRRQAGPALRARAVRRHRAVRAKSGFKIFAGRRRATAASSRPARARRGREAVARRCSTA